MAVQKFLRLVAGVFTETTATTTSAGSGDGGKIVALDDTTGKLDNSVLPSGIGADTASIVSSENLAAGDFVNVYDNAGTATVRKADADASKPAHGFVLAAVTSPAAATVYFEGTNNQITGATAGDVFLSATAGGFTATPPSGSGNLVQKLGVAVSATAINVEIQPHVVLA